MSVTAKKIVKIVALVSSFIIVLIGCYCGYVVFSYSRIEDGVSAEVVNKAEQESVREYQEYIIVTQNLGFGAYTQDFTFFMDGGTQSRAASAESVKNCINSASEKVKEFNPSFVFFQEVDIDSDRSYHIDQRKIVQEHFPDYSTAFSLNYHSAYLFYPFYQPHGASNSGLLTYSAFTINNSIRRSLPISTGFSKFLDLDRCYTVTRISATNNKELVLFNVHLSAYGGNDEIRAAQMSMLLSEMAYEYERGNYCVCGGDFNHDFTGTSTQDLNGGAQVDFGWAQPFPAEMLEEYKVIRRADSYYNDQLVPTCRNCDVPYKEGNFTIIVDGFLVTDNVRVIKVENVDCGFVYSDHNPVVMHFSLQS